MNNNTSIFRKSVYIVIFMLVVILERSIPNLGIGAGTSFTLLFILLILEKKIFTSIESYFILGLIVDLISTAAFGLFTFLFILFFILWNSLNKLVPDILLFIGFYFLTVLLVSLVLYSINFPILTVSMVSSIIFYTLSRFIFNHFK